MSEGRLSDRHALPPLISPERPCPTCPYDACTLGLSRTLYPRYRSACNYDPLTHVCANVRGLFLERIEHRDRIFVYT